MFRLLVVLRRISPSTVAPPPPSLCREIRRRCSPLPSDTQSGCLVKDWTHEIRGYRLQVVLPRLITSLSLLRLLDIRHIRLACSTGEDSTLPREGVPADDRYIHRRLLPRGPFVTAAARRERIKGRTQPSPGDVPLRPTASELSPSQLVQHVGRRFGSRAKQDD